MEWIREAMMFISSVIAGLFIGFIAGVISVFVIEIAGEIISEKAKFLVPGALLLAYFGGALYYAIQIGSSNVTLTISSVILYSWMMRGVFSFERQ